MKKLNGIKLNHRKNTENSVTVDFPLPSRVKIPMLMNMGAPCQPLVKVGDEVKAIRTLRSVFPYTRAFRAR